MLDETISQATDQGLADPRPRLAQRGRHGVLHFDADDGVAATPDGVLLDRLKQVAGCFFVWAITLGVLPGLHVLPHLPSLDYGWAFRHPRTGLILFVALLLFGGLLVAWLVERVEDFWGRVAQGFAALSDRPYYFSRVVPFQLLDWTLRITTIFFFLRAFQIPATLHNALLVQVSQSLATVFPFSPAGIGTEPPPIRTDSGMRKARGASASL